MMAAAAAALPAALSAIPALKEGTKLAGDVVGHISAALNKSILEFEVEGPLRLNRRRGPVPDARLKIAFPAWLVVGGAAALWIMGLGIAVNRDGKLGWTNRPRMVLPFTSGTGGIFEPFVESIPGGSTAALGYTIGSMFSGPIGGIAAGLGALFGDWLGRSR